MEDIVQYQLGDVVFCREDLFSDGGLPGYEEGALVAAAFIGPGTVTTATLAGANFGYALLWALVFLPVM